MEQRSPEWYEARLGLPTASCFDKVLASNTTESYKGYKTEIVLERLFGMDAPHLQNPYINSAMQWGIDQEPLARLSYILATGNIVEETGFHKHKTLEVGASPDGIVNPKKEKKGLEIKCPTTAVHLYTLRTGKLPGKYVSQVQGQMLVCGFNSVDFVSYDPRLPSNAQMIIIPVKRDNSYIEILEGKLKQFLAEVKDDIEFINDYGKKKNEV
jgi:putative phage-type endonuclease